MVTGHLGTERHQNYKSKIAELLRKEGYIVQGDDGQERIFPCVNRDRHPVNYYADLYAEGKNRRLLIEVHGYRGHDSPRAVKLDKNRWKDMDMYYNHDAERKKVKSGIEYYEPILEYFELWFWQIKGDMEQEILRDLKVLKTERI